MAHASPVRPGDLLNVFKEVAPVWRRVACLSRIRRRSDTTVTARGGRPRMSRWCVRRGGSSSCRSCSRWASCRAAGPRKSTRRVRTSSLIYADDAGYGDVSAYGVTRVRTPNIDRLAAEGMRFTDAHSAAATCTPSRYALLTGQYAWRQSGHGHSSRERGAHHRPRHVPRCRACCSARATSRASSANGISAWDRRQGPIGTARSRRGRSKSDSPRASSWPRRAIACRRSTSKTGAWWDSIRAIRSRSAIDQARRRLADRPRQSRTPHDASEPRPRPDDRERHQPHRLHDRWQGSAVEGRGHGRRVHAQGGGVPRRASGQAVFPDVLAP